MPPEVSFHFSDVHEWMNTMAQIQGPGCVWQSVTSLTADQGIASSISAQSHTFVEIDMKRFLRQFFSLSLIQEEFLSVTSESMYTKHWLTA